MATKEAAAAPTFRKGAEAAKEAAKRTAFRKTNFLSIDDGDHVIVRFLTEPTDWITVDQHQMVTTKEKPSNAKGNWPTKMGAVCRHDPAFEAIFDSCYICDEMLPEMKPKEQQTCKPKPRTWALAVLREEVREGGKLKGYRDQTREVAKLDKDGKATKETTKEKAYVVCNFAYDNFFKPLAQLAGVHGTLLDRDYHITREGENLDTGYTPIHLDPVPAKNPETGTMEKFDLREAHFMQRYEDAPVLGDLVFERCSDEFYGRFFDKNVTIEDDDDNGPAEKAKPSNEVDPEKLKSLANRVKGYKPGQEGEVDGGDETTGGETTEDASADDGPQDLG